MNRLQIFLGFSFASLCVLPLFSQPYSEADRGQLGDPHIQEYLRIESQKLEADFLQGLSTAEQWNRELPRMREEYFHMLGLWPLPEKTPLKATVTRTLEQGDYAVEMVHFQSRPGLYVTCNLFRPFKVNPGERLPAIVYVCGHSGRGRDGNKTAYQSFGIWFARHGYVCLVLDTLQLGEIAGIHHGTYRENRWWWISRGYTSAGVECWNGVRAIDYLVSRPEVDPERLAVTGISGGGAATFWIAAADERIRVAVPVSGMADLLSYVPNRVVNGHCDCMFLYNTFQWPWARIAALIAPRPMLFANSDQDAIFPMDANDRVIARLERLYSLFGASDRVDACISIGGHAYRQDLREATYRFLNAHLKNDARPVTDSEIDLVTGSTDDQHPIAPRKLRVFPEDSDIPKDAVNGRIDEQFVPMAKLQLPSAGAWPKWREDLLKELKRVTFHHFPEEIPAATLVEKDGPNLALGTEPGITIHLRELRAGSAKPDRIILWLAGTNSGSEAPSWLAERLTEQDAIYVVQPRGIGPSAWTQKNPPNYVERSHYLLGRTVDSGRVWDAAAAAAYFKQARKGTSVWLAGEKGSAGLAAYAALLQPSLGGVILNQPPESHMNSEAPVLLNVLRVLDLPEAVGLLAPQPVVLIGAPEKVRKRSAAMFELAKASDRLKTSEK